jgi:HEAT repeat protein
MPLIWFDSVNPEQSVAWLASLIADASAGRRSNRLIDPALSALAMHASPASARTLVSLARDGQPSSLRGQALVWLGQHAGAQAGPAIADAIERDPELDVKRRAVVALGQLPRDEGVPLLITVARTHKSTEVRRQAMLTLGQSNDPRALAFFEQILSK